MPLAETAGGVQRTSYDEIPILSSIAMTYVATLGGNAAGDDSVREKIHQKHLLFDILFQLVLVYSFQRHRRLFRNVFVRLA